MPYMRKEIWRIHMKNDIQCIVRVTQQHYNRCSMQCIVAPAKARGTSKSKAWQTDGRTDRQWTKLFLFGHMLPWRHKHSITHQLRTNLEPRSKVIKLKIISYSKLFNKEVPLPSSELRHPSVLVRTPSVASGSVGICVVRRPAAVTPLVWPLGS